MKNRELAATVTHLRRLLADPRLKTAYREKLQKALKELEKVKRSGKLDQRKVFRATDLIASTLIEMLPGSNSSAQDETPAAVR